MASRVDLKVTASGAEALLLFPLLSRELKLPPPISFKVTQWLELRTTLRRSAGAESRLLRTTSMWPSLNRSPKAAPRAQTTEASPLPVAGATSSNLEPFKLRNNNGRCAQVVPQSCLSTPG